MRRPALWAALYFVIGIGIQMFSGVLFHALILAACVVMGIGMVGFWRRWNAWYVSVTLVCFLILLGALRSAQSSLYPANHFLPTDDNVVGVDSVVISEPECVGDDYRVIYELHELVVNDTARSVAGRALLKFRAGTHVPAYGDQMQLEVPLYRPGPPRNPGAFDYKSYLARRGIDVLGTIRKPAQIIELDSSIVKSDWWALVIWPLRNHIRSAIEQNLSGGPAGLLMGVLLGEKGAVPKEIQVAFARTGVNHVLAVSGLHVGLTAGVTILSLVLYALVTGLPPSVVRAATMGCVALIGIANERDIDGGNVLGLAGLGLLIARPQDLMDIGFQLSFVATGGILVFYKPLRELFPSKGGWWDTWVVGPLAVSLSAQVTTLSFVVGYFGLVSVIGILANLIVVPLVGLGVGLGLLTVVAFALWEPLATILNASNWLILTCAISCAEIMARPDWAAFEISRPPWFFFAIYLSLIPLLHPDWRRMCGAYLLIGCLLFANIGVWKEIVSRSSALEIYFLDVGQGDATFLKYPNGLTLLVDGGIRTQTIAMGERVVIPFLRSQGISHIDVVVGSHPHADHIGGLISVLGQISVSHYLDAGQYTESFTNRLLYETIAARGVVYHSVAAGDSLVGIGGLVLHPTPTYVSESGPAPDGLNNGSVVIRIAHEGRSLLLTGDVEHETDDHIIRWGKRLEADVLKAAHHGSRTSSTLEFVKKRITRAQF